MTYTKPVMCPRPTMASTGCPGCAVCCAARHVVVASSPSGSRNVFYEGIRCPTAEVKTYARHNGDKWVMASDPKWQPMALQSSRHAFALARQGACENAGTPSRAEDVVRTLKLPAGAIVR